jgi:hypothetical protein
MLNEVKHLDSKPRRLSRASSCGRDASFLSMTRFETISPGRGAQDDTRQSRILLLGALEWRHLDCCCPPAAGQGGGLVALARPMRPGCGTMPAGGEDGLETPIRPNVRNAHETGAAAR